MRVSVLMMADIMRQTSAVPLVFRIGIEDHARPAHVRTYVKNAYKPAAGHLRPAELSMNEIMARLSHVQPFKSEFHIVLLIAISIRPFRE